MDCELSVGSRGVVYLRRQSQGRKRESPRSLTGTLRPPALVNCCAPVYHRLLEGRDEPLELEATNRRWTQGELRARGD